MSSNRLLPLLRPLSAYILLQKNHEVLIINENSFSYANTDIFVAKIDGTNLTQITYHAADDLSPVWSRDGKYIYFISQRGSDTGTANIWRMNFNY